MQWHGHSGQGQSCLVDWHQMLSSALVQGRECPDLWLPAPVQADIAQPTPPYKYRRLEHELRKPDRQSVELQPLAGLGDSHFWLSEEWPAPPEPKGSRSPRASETDQAGLPAEGRCPPALWDFGWPLP